MDLIKSVNVQDLINKDIFEDMGKQHENDLLEILDFTMQNGVPLTENQVKGWFLLNEMGLEDIALYANAIRPKMTPIKRIYEMVNKITLADRIRGNAKLSNLLKSTVPSGSQAVPSANDLQAKALKEKDLH